MVMRCLEFSASQLSQLADYIERQHPGIKVDQDDLSTRLIAVLSSATVIPPHAPIPAQLGRNISQDGLLVELAELFLAFANIPTWPFDLPYASDQRFYQFANAAMHPLYGSSDARRRSIAVRWRKLKATAAHKNPNGLGIQMDT
jgi:hypothetical protein